MKKTSTITASASWFLGLIIFTLGILNLILIHPVPALAYTLLSLLFFPPVEEFLRRKLGFFIPFPVLVVLALVIFWFTLGISDLGEMFGL